MSQPNESQPDAPHDTELQQIREALRGLRYGSVNIIVQDGLIVQIDRTEKRRLRGARDERAEKRE